MLVQTNIIPWVMENPDQKVFIYAMYLKTKDSLQEMLRKKAFDSLAASDLLQFRANSDSLPKSKPAVHTDGMFLFTNLKLKDLVKVYSLVVEDDTLEIRVMFRGTRRLRQCHGLLKSLLYGTAEELGYSKVHRKYVDPEACAEVPGSDLVVYGAYRLRLSLAAGDPGILIDVTTSIQRKTSVADILSKSTKFNLERIKSHLYGKHVTNSALNEVYEILEIVFEVGNSRGGEVEATGEPQGNEEFEGNRGNVNNVSVVYTLQGALQQVNAADCQLLATRRGAEIKFKEELPAVLGLSRISSTLRFVGIRNVLKKLQENDQKLRKWGVSYGPRPTMVLAKILPPPTISFGNDVSEEAKFLFWCHKTETPKPFYRAMSCEKWQFFCLPEHSRLAQEMADSLAYMGSKYGMKLSRIRVKPVSALKASDVERCRFLNTIRKAVVVDTQIIVVLMPSGAANKSYERLYERIKKFCTSGRQLVSQMIRHSTLKSRSPGESSWNALTCSLLNGINCKLGGSPWKVSIPEIENSTMLVGMDVWHDAFSHNASIGAICCTLNEDLSEIFSAATFHAFHDEIFKYEALKVHLVRALQAYERKNGRLPVRILVYRDGTNCRQYSKIRQIELPAIIAAAEAVYGEQRLPAITVVIVHKRIYERFFTEKNGRMENVPPGTLIDTEVIRRCGRGRDQKPGLNFFLSSKYREVGTSVPTHYEVLYDNSNMAAEQLQTVTYGLCYAYLNWPGVFYVPCMIQYAHKLASSVSKTGVVPPNGMTQKLHFL